MKRVISAFIISLAFAVACSEDISLTPGISFLTPQPEIYEETAIFRIISQQFDSADTLKIPVSIGGTAQKGTDYDISAEYFTITKESLMDSIVVYTKTLGTGKTVSLDLQIPEGFTAGKYTSSELKLQDKYGYLSFEFAESAISDTTRFAVVVTDSTEKAKVVTKNTPIDIAVNKEKTTAVEGVDFELLYFENIEIATGGYYTTFSVAPLKTDLAEGSNLVVLTLFESDKFNVGKFPEIVISLQTETETLPE